MYIYATRARGGDGVRVPISENLRFSARVPVNKNVRALVNVC